MVEISDAKLEALLQRLNELEPKLTEIEPKLDELLAALQQLVREEVDRQMRIGDGKS